MRVTGVSINFDEGNTPISAAVTTDVGLYTTSFISTGGGDGEPAGDPTASIHDPLTSQNVATLVWHAL